MTANQGELQYEGRDLEAMSFAANYSRWIRDEFGGAIRGRVCEVGAGSGNFTELLLDGAAHVTALEPSAAMHARLAARFDGEARVETARSFLADFRVDAPFDAFVYNNVLEHVDDDRAELALVRERLKPGGALCIFVPALPWLMSDFDRSIGHVRRYRRAELRDKLVDAGFVIERLHWFDMPGILPWFVAMRLMRGGLGAGKVSTYDRVAVPAIRALETRLRPPIGRNLVAVARRP